MHYFFCLQHCHIYETVESKFQGTTKPERSKEIHFILKKSRSETNNFLKKIFIFFSLNRQL